MKGTVEKAFDREVQREYVMYDLAISGTLGVTDKVEEVDLLRDHSLETRVTNIDGRKEQVVLRLERMAEDFAVRENDAGKILMLNAQHYGELVRTGEVYARNGRYSLRITLD